METPSFVCAPCNFETTLRANFNRHCNTAKHIKLCECEVFTEIKVVSKQDENSIVLDFFADSYLTMKMTS